MRGFLISFAAAVTLSTSAAQAGHSGSMEDQLACTPDVYRLCSTDIPDEDRIVACLQRNRAALSGACAKVFSRQDQATPAAPDNGDSDD